MNASARSGWGSHGLSPLARAARGAMRLASPLVGERPMTVQALCDEAQRSTGLADFGDPAFIEPLDQLLRSIEAEARLHALGRAITRGRIRALLESRLRVQAFARAHPEVNDFAPTRPIVIAGLQRTGTTMLHRLIAADPSARALRSWEALAPAPLPGEGERGSRVRLRNAKFAEQGLRALSPEFFAIHPVEAAAPEEDVLLVDLSFTSQAPEATMHVPSYARWLESQQLDHAYRFLKTALGVLHWQRPGAFWVLKTPHHMEYLRELVAVFPDAVIVQTHRDPQSTMPSFCSMVAHGRRVFSDAVDPREVGRHWLRKVQRMLERAQAVRDGAPRDARFRFVDVRYASLMKDPIAEVARIYEAAGRALDPRARAAMERARQTDRQHKYGKHEYRAEDFGLSPARIEATFASYRARYEIPHERRDDRASRGASSVRTDNPALAVLTGLRSMRERRGGLSPLGPEQRLDDKTVLITGANVGLGRAVAIDLARRGARVLIAGRSGIPDAGRAIAEAASSRRVEMLRVDLSDLRSVASLADALAARGDRLDVFIGNAGVMPARATPSAQGYELLYAVHVFANALLARRLLSSGVLPNDVFAKNGRAPLEAPRMIFVASESHRSSRGLDLARLGSLVPYGVTDGTRHYGDSKLALVTFAVELARRLTVGAAPSVGVHALCPGPVHTKIARDAPAPIAPALDVVMRWTFASPEEAAAPVALLAAAPELEGETGWYLHMLERKSPAPWALDAANGRALWAAIDERVAPFVEARSSSD